MMVKNLQSDYFAQCAWSGSAIKDCLVIDAHGHLGPVPAFPYVDSTADSLVAVMDRVGIDRLYASAGPAVFGQAQLGNDMLIEAMGKYPGRIFGYMAIDSGYSARIPGQLQRCLKAGFSGIKIWSYGARAGLRYDHANYDMVFRFANEHGLPVLAHTWGEELDHLDQAFKTYKNINWILAHTGSNELEKYIKVGNEYENVYLETCLSLCPRGLIETLVREVPVEKILWGSDQPFMSCTQQIGRVLLAQITTEQKQAILGVNAAKVLGS